MNVLIAWDVQGTAGMCLTTVLFPLWHVQPTMDIYSLGVLLFIMLCGRKPWDPHQVHTLHYGTYSIQDAPGLKDKRFESLSPEARNLLLALLSDKPRDRLPAAKVLCHPWMKQDAVAGYKRVIGGQVQRRIQMLARNRYVRADILPTCG